MSLQSELGYLKPFKHPVEETMLNIVHTGNLLVKEACRVLGPFGLTDAQFNVLMILRYNSSDGRINQTSLGRKMLVNRSNITGLVDRMEKAGLVRRISDPGDRRVNQVQMTEQGSRVLEQAHRAYFSRIEEIMAGLSDARQKSLSEMLVKVRAGLRGQES
jgi:DNA-binding MarR family transcriptional regulator